MNMQRWITAQNLISQFFMMILLHITIVDAPFFLGGMRKQKLLVYQTIDK